MMIICREKIMSVAVAAKELGVTKRKIKVMIKNHLINYKIINGKYFIDTDSLKTL